MKKYRIKAYSRLEPIFGYEGRSWNQYQDLQVKRWWGWETIATERLPDWVWSYNAVGGSGWVSKFSWYGTWGRDGIITPHSA